MTDTEKAPYTDGSDAPLSSETLRDDLLQSPQADEQDVLTEAGDTLPSDTEPADTQEQALESNLINLPPG